MIDTDCMGAASAADVEYNGFSNLRKVEVDLAFSRQTGRMIARLLY
jgi:hypothetical protein